MNSPVRESGPPRRRRRYDPVKPFLAPLLITTILAAGQYQYGILEGHLGTLIAIVTSIGLEIVLSRLLVGRWPHPASAYITGISVGILVRTPLLWPYIICSVLSIISKYALRYKGRHLWNPSNLGVSILLFLVPSEMVPLSQQWGNDIWVPLIIMALGSLILFSLGRLHITLTYVAAFSLLSLLRSGLTERAWVVEMAVLTSPAYLLFMFFMITDPKTTTRTRGRRCAVAVLVAAVESLLRLEEVIHAPYYALFIVAPVTNLLEIWWDGRHRLRPAPVLAEPAVVGTAPPAPVPSTP